jgi:TRAP-type C4-dicarboxylate transport system permease small subunit
MELAMAEHEVERRVSLQSIAGNDLVPAKGLLGRCSRIMRQVNRSLVWIGGLSLVAAAAVLTEGVVARYVFHAATDWQDEMAVFLIIGATFVAGAAVQERRGHIAIEAFIGSVGTRYDRLRCSLVDAVSLIFAVAFTWYCANRLVDAMVEHQATDSAWAAPLALPYGLMTAGLGLLCLQILLQLVDELIRLADRP